jgi:hypothetical protein
VSRRHALHDSCRDVAVCARRMCTDRVRSSRRLRRLPDGGKWPVNGDSELVALQLQQRCLSEREFIQGAEMRIIAHCEYVR